MSSWREANKPAAAGKPRYAIIKGKAYHNVLPASQRQKSNKVTTNFRDRDRYQHDPVVMLNEADMDDINGAKDAPLCYMHKANDVIGKVQHTWLDPEPDGKQALSIWAKIPLNERGERIVQEIRAGKLTGFSVSYKTDLNHKDSTELIGKEFREISIVDDPFFEGCHLTVGVLAGKDATAVDATG
jgi:hypothetical protein